jgi:hypothetical protein
MLSPILPGCTRSLDSTIADQRVRHAAERLDFHAHFEFMTVDKIQRILRKKDRRHSLDEPRRRRQELVVDLLAAQQEHPHMLWTLLLLVAFERDLVQRRRSLSAAVDAALDHLVVDAFVATVDDIPHAIGPYELRAHVLRAWRRRLRKAMRGRPLPRTTPVARRAA